MLHGILKGLKNQDVCQFLNTEILMVIGTVTSFRFCNIYWVRLLAFHFFFSRKKRDDELESLYNLPARHNNWAACYTVFEQVVSWQMPLHHFLRHVEWFQENDALPNDIWFTRDTTVADFISNSASWHKSCHLKYFSSLMNAKKRKLVNTKRDADNQMVVS